ncbi:hypothetical protein P7K49_000959, partial [Saguinus oedipus]
MRPPCPWRKVGAAELRPEAPGRRDGKDVGFLSPGNCPGCEQEEAAAHPGRSHPGECSRRAAGPVTLPVSAPCEGRSGRPEAGLQGHGRVRALGRSEPPCRLLSLWPPVAAINKFRAGLLLSSWQLRFPVRRATPACGPESSGVGVLWGRAPSHSCRSALFRLSDCTEAERTRLSGCRVVARSPSLEVGCGRGERAQRQRQQSPRLLRRSRSRRTK